MATTAAPPGRVRRGGALLLLAAAASACLGARLFEPRYPMSRQGPDRTQVAYDDPREAEKRALFERINRDRERHGVPPVQYDTRAAIAGDLFCLDSAMAGPTGHWDLQGRAPYVRWGLAGGVDFHAENAATYSVSSGTITRPLAPLMLEAHESMMAETSPDDGHRRTILSPSYTHVGIGLAAVAGEVRMTEEFTRVAFEWIETPAVPLRAGQRASFAGRPVTGWEIGAIEIRFESPPRPLTVMEVRRRRAYGYPTVVQTLLPVVPSGYARGGRGDFDVRGDGSFSAGFKLDQGPGYYFVVCHLRKARDLRGPMEPATAAMITALP